jgi:hypothetical protein
MYSNPLLTKNSKHPHYLHCCAVCQSWYSVLCVNTDSRPIGEVEC